jgi:hypothetical protein
MSPLLADFVAKEGAQVEIAGRPGSPPACIFALGSDQLDFDGDAAVGERRYAHTEAVAHLQRASLRRIIEVPALFCYVEIKDLAMIL